MARKIFWGTAMHASHYVAVAIGGALGAIFRVALGKILPQVIAGLPTHILFINVIGCLAMGALTELMAIHWSPPDYLRYFLISGMLGGFTTFSAFSLEFGLLVLRNEYLLAFAYASLSFLLSTLAFFAGLKVVRVII